MKIGIIDTLTYYGFKKKVANFAKHLVKDNQDTKPPDEYRNRFINYIRKSVFKLKDPLN